MRWTKLFKPAGAIATTACAVVTGIAVNLSILSSGPDGAGNLSLNAHRATTTSAPVTQTTQSQRHQRAARVVVRVASVPAAAEVVVPETTTPSSGSAQPLNGGAGTTTPPSTKAPATTTTTAPPSGARTFAVGHTGTIATQWLDDNTIVVTAHAASGWKVHLTERANLIEARFDGPTVRIVWRALVIDRSLKVEVLRYPNGSSTPVGGATGDGTGTPVEPRP